MTKIDNHTEQVKASRRRITEAESNLVRLRTEYTTATELYASLEARLNAGDESVTTDELLAAERDVQRLASLVAAAIRELATAKRQAVNDDTAVADAIAGAVQEVLHGTVEVLPVAKLSNLPATVGSVPPVWVLQSKPSQVDTVEGTVNAEITLARLRDERHHVGLAEFVDDLDDKLQRFGVRIRKPSHPRHLVPGYSTTPASGGLVLDTLRIAVQAYTDKPAIRTGMAQDFRAGLLASQICEPTSWSERWQHDDFRVAGQGINGDVRTVEIEGEIYLSGQPGVTLPGQGANDVGTASGLLADLVKGLPGTFAAGLGVVTTASIVGAVRPVGRPGGSQLGAAATVRITLVSTVAVEHVASAA